MITLYCKGERSSKIMAMIKCPECGNEISDTAKACPICGCPIKTEKLKRNLPKKVIAIMSVVIIIVLVIAVRSVTHRSNTSSNLTEKEQIELSKIYSVCGLFSERESLMESRPYRNLHHTITNFYTRKCTSPQQTANTSKQCCYPCFL